MNQQHDIKIVYLYDFIKTIILTYNFQKDIEHVMYSRENVIEFLVMGITHVRSIHLYYVVVL